MNTLNYTGKLILGTSFYQSQAHSGYTHSMVATVAVLEKLGVRWDFWPVSGDFHVERAVNNMLGRFLNDPEATDFLLIDSDESWDVQAVIRLLMHPEEVVGCGYRMKNNWERYTCTLKSEDGVPIGKMLKDGTVLLAADRLPGGFLRLRRSALEKFVAAYPDEWFWEGNKDNPTKVPAFFISTVRDHQFFSCDYDFCEKLKAIGVDLWVDPNADIAHHGMTAYPGNLDKYLRNEKAEREAFAVVREMANAA